MSCPVFLSYSLFFLFSPLHILFSFSSAFRLSSPPPRSLFDSFDSVQCCFVSFRFCSVRLESVGREVRLAACVQNGVRSFVPVAVGHQGGVRVRVRLVLYPGLRAALESHPLLFLFPCSPPSLLFPSPLVSSGASNRFGVVSFRLVSVGASAPGGVRAV